MQFFSSLKEQSLKFLFKEKLRSQLSFLKRSSKLHQNILVLDTYRIQYRHSRTLTCKVLNFRQKCRPIQVNLLMYWEIIFLKSTKLFMCLILSIFLRVCLVQHLSCCAKFIIGVIQLTSIALLNDFTTYLQVGDHKAAKSLE